jgi:ClpP class serine protease
MMEASLSLTDKRQQRVDLIKGIEEKLKSRLLVYFTADSPIVGGMVSEDAILPMYDHVRGIGKQARITLFLYSSGGQMETPWKLVTMLREFCEEFHVVVPYKAYSAATMICIGTDKIHMTPKSELGPIDPALQVNPLAGKEGATIRLPDLGVEDIAALSDICPGASQIDRPGRGERGRNQPD